VGGTGAAPVTFADLPVAAGGIVGGAGTGEGRATIVLGAGAVALVDLPLGAGVLGAAVTLRHFPSFPHGI
jgi:hypothetical protein